MQPKGEFMRVFLLAAGLVLGFGVSARAADGPSLQGISDAGQAGGLALIIGAEHEALIAELAAHGRWVVWTLETEAAAADRRTKNFGSHPSDAWVYLPLPTDKDGPVRFDDERLPYVVLELEEDDEGQQAREPAEKPKPGKPKADPK
jgi:hypothetical protein